MGTRRLDARAATLAKAVKTSLTLSKAETKYLVELYHSHDVLWSIQ